MSKKLTLAFLVAVFSFFALEAEAATISVSPSTSNVTVNQVFTVNISLDTTNQDVDGVDIYSLNFNPSILEVVDSNSSASGIQIQAGSLMPITVINSADNATGKIQFSQASAGGTKYKGSGTLASVTFRAKQSGSSSLNFNFTLGSGADTNVAAGGVDVLNAVTNGNVTVQANNPNPSPTSTTDTVAPTASVTYPSSGTTLSGTINLSATASDNVGVYSVQYKIDGAWFGLENVTAPYILSLDTRTLTNGSHSIVAVARDNTGNSGNSSAVTFYVSNTTSNPTSTTPTPNPTDSNLPTTSITYPSNGAVISGTVTLTAIASDNTGIAGVQFKVDGDFVGAEDITSPYAVTFGTSKYSKGTHTIIAMARDTAGNFGYSSPVTVTIDNTTTAISSTSSGLPVINFFRFEPSYISPGQTAQAIWSASLDDEIYLNPGIGKIARTGSYLVKPSQTTTYQLTAKNSKGETFTNATLIVLGQTQSATDIANAEKAAAINQILLDIAAIQNRIKGMIGRVITTAELQDILGQVQSLQARVNAISNVSQSLTRNLRFGMENDFEVRILQEKLKAKGFYSGPITGSFYQLTLEAVKKYQASQGIEATGYVGSATRTALNR